LPRRVVPPAAPWPAPASARCGLSAGESDEPEEGHRAVGPDDDLLVEALTLLTIDQHEIEAVLERLECGADRDLRVDGAPVQFGAAGANRTARRAFLDLLGGESVQKLILLLPLAELLDLLADDARDQITQGERRARLTAEIRRRELEVGCQ